MRPAPRALLVEHDTAIRETMKLALETLGFEAVVATIGEEAVEAVTGEMLAIACVETRLPGALSGIETLESLKLKLPSLPVIVLAEPDRPEDILAAFHAGAADVLLKPFELEELRAALGRALAGSGEAVGLDFHARLELAKTALATSVLGVAEAHLLSALQMDPLDAEVLNLYGVVTELRGDPMRATRAYRAAFASDPKYGRARRNLERITEQFAFIGPVGEMREDPLTSTRPRIAVPLIDPLRDLPLVRLAKLVGGAACGVIVGVLLDPPSQEAGPSRLIGQRAGFVRASGRDDPGSVPCLTCYVLAEDQVAGMRTLAERFRPSFLLVGAWTPEPLRAAFRAAPLLIAREAQIPAADAVACPVDGPRAGTTLALASHLALALRAPLVFPAAFAEGDEVASLPAGTLYERTGLTPPDWLDPTHHVGVRRLREGDSPLVVGESPDAFLRIA